MLNRWYVHSNFNLKSFRVKIFSWGTLENLFTWIFNTWIFSYMKISRFTVCEIKMLRMAWSITLIVFWLPSPVIQIHKSCFFPHILTSYFGKQHNNLLCSTLTSSQPHSVRKSLFHNPFQVLSATFYFNYWM